MMPARFFGVAVAPLALLIGCTGAGPPNYAVLAPGARERPMDEYRSAAASARTESEAMERYKRSVSVIEGIGTLDQPLRPLYVPFPEYPDEARRLSLEGVVELVITIHETGFVESTFVSKSADPLLDRAAVRAVSTWRFAPNFSQGKPTKVRAYQRFPFVIRNE